MQKREWRTSESLEAESFTRGLITDFLSVRGFSDIHDNRRPIGSTTSQTVEARSPEGERIAMRVKLCWRPRGSGRDYSAAQLMSSLPTGNWENDIQVYVDRARTAGVTHFLFARGEGSEITQAALVPAQNILRIWRDQRDISQGLINKGLLGRRRKNHAMNGASPTIWLHDDSAPSVTDALWNDDSVFNLLYVPPLKPKEFDDTYADLYGIDSSLLGRDVADRLLGTRSFVKRDPRVRADVLRRAGGKCERCQSSRPFSAFLDVHHILGAEKSDRPWSCVAICPNCHREAHFSPNHIDINAHLLIWASQFGPNIRLTSKNRDS